MRKKIILRYFEYTFIFLFGALPFYLMIFIFGMVWESPTLENYLKFQREVTQAVESLHTEITEHKAMPHDAEIKEHKARVHVYGREE